MKDFRFVVDAAPLHDRRVRVTSSGKAPLEAATPPEFRGGLPGRWSPEHLLVASVASCYVITLESIAERRGVPIRGLAVEGVGHVTRRAEGRLGFVVIELCVDLTVAPEFVGQAEHAAHSAKRSCLIGHALEIPIELELRVTTEEPRRITAPAT